MSMGRIASPSGDTPSALGMDPKPRLAAKAVAGETHGVYAHAMKVLNRRIRRLEDRFGSAGGPSFLVVKSCVHLRLDSDTCVEILSECGFVAARGLVIVDLCKVPKGLTANETETYLRKHGAELCK
jgi:hypothetical protein